MALHASVFVFVLSFFLFVLGPHETLRYHCDESTMNSALAWPNHLCVCACMERVNTFMPLFSKPFSANETGDELLNHEMAILEVVKWSHSSRRSFLFGYLNPTNDANRIDHDFLFRNHFSNGFYDNLFITRHFFFSFFFAYRCCGIWTHFEDRSVNWAITFAAAMTVYSVP